MSFAQTPLIQNKPLATCTDTIKSIQLSKTDSNIKTFPPAKDWQAIDQLPINVQKYFKNFNGDIWFKIAWQHQCDHASNEPIMLLLSQLNMAGEVYLNQDLIWRDQSLVEPLSRSWNMPRYWSLPASSLKQEDNIIWVRIVAVASQNSGLGQMHIGSAQEVIPQYKKYWYKQRGIHFFNLLFSLTLGSIAGLIWLFRHEEKAFGWFSLSSFTWVFIMMNVVLTEPIFGLKTLQMAKINIIAILAFSIFTCLYAWRLANLSFRKIETVLFTLLASSVTIALLIPDAILDVFLICTFLISVFILLINFITFPFIAYKTKQLESYFLAAIFITYFIITLHDIISIVFWPSRNIYIAAYTAPITTLFVALVLAMRLSNNIQHIENFNKTLEDKVIQTKQELSSSLNTQHQLEIQNTKLQERIRLAHDLHDGLGGSLVRSMALVDQSKQNLSNQQFSSILKILRNDLRQIIDSGSSFNAITPENPKIWGAAIRYRFVQIFDELDVQSTWTFPERWEIKPNTLECLSLLRVIEESLTNIIKHSQAKNVEVHLYYNSHEQLVLVIQDDGIGFDVDAVIKSGLSVGIRSIQVRLSHIQAELKIQSEHGMTKIEVTKSFSI